MPTFAYVGCYTTAHRQARGDGIHIYKVDVKAGTWTHVNRLADQVNPSFLALSRDRRFLYSVHGDERYASSFAIYRPTGELTPVAKADTGGSNGVHLAQSPDGRFMVVANYGSGSVSVLPVQPNGRMVNQIQVVELEGASGPHRVEQASSHPHQIVFDPSGLYVLVPDKGLDRIFVLSFDPSTGHLGSHGSVAARSGSGPRHLAFHPKLPLVWALNELNSSVTTYSWDADHGALKPIQTVPSLPADFNGESTAAEIAVSKDGGFLYCSNRGHDSIAVFQTDARKGTLTPLAWTPSGGKSPRFICFDPGGRFLLAANEQEDCIATFRVDNSSGRLTAAGQPVANASPVTIAFLKGDQKAMFRWLGSREKSPEQTAMPELGTQTSVDDLLARDVVVLFKHSHACPVSWAAHSQMSRFAAHHPDVPVNVINVIKERAFSRQLAQRLEVEHESPQVIVLRRGIVEAVASHGDITEAGLARMLQLR